MDEVLIEEKEGEQWFYPSATQICKEILRVHQHGGYPKEFNEERREVTDALQRLGAVCCGQCPLDLSGTNRMMIRVKCPKCKSLVLRYRPEAQRSASKRR